MTLKRVKSAQKRKAKKAKSAARSAANRLARKGRVQFGRQVHTAEWGRLVLKPDVPESKWHTDDVERIRAELAALAESGNPGSVKHCADGSYVIIENAASFETADTAYDDGIVDPLDVMVENGLPEDTKFLGYVVCNGKGQFLAPADDGSMVDKAENGLMFMSQNEAEDRAIAFKQGFAAMVFDTGNEVFMGITKPT